MQNGNDFRVLVLEDEVFIGMLLEDMLTELGCARIDIVASVEKALDFLEGGTPDFAVLDINLNGERSFPVAEVLASRGTPFVFVSGYGEGGIGEGSAGAKILQKPFRLSDLEAVLQGVLGGRREVLSPH